MKLYDDKFRSVHGYREGKADSIDPESARKAADYKKTFLKNFISINQNQIDSRLGGDKFFVTRKIDGEYAIIFHDRGRTVTVNRSGRVREGIACIEEAGRLIERAGYKQAIAPAEIYVSDDDRKTRVNDLISALANKNKTDSLKLAVFDLLELDGQPVDNRNFQKTWNKINEIFGEGRRCHPVDMEVAASVDGVKELFLRWVENEGSEGLVVHTELPVVYKIKPRHNIDVVVVGFSEGTGIEAGQVRSLLTALIPEEGKYQVISRVGSGLKETLRKEMYRRFSRTILDSDYIETDANHVAFHMVRPEMVIEVSVNDLLFDTSSGPKQNPVLTIKDGRYELDSTVDGFKFLAPVFERVREDKKADENDVRPEQIGSFTYRPEPLTLASFREPLPPSELLIRDVYRKQIGEKTMVLKFLLWRTHKEQTLEYPAYVLHITNFSTGRMEPLQREIRVSSSLDQILELYQIALAENVKKGWKQVSLKQYEIKEENIASEKVDSETVAKSPVTKK